MNVFYSPAYVGSAHAFATTRKAKWVVDSLRAAPVEGAKLVEPIPLTLEQVDRIHDPSYVRAVQTGAPRALAESQDFEWDPGLCPMVLASNGGVVAAALDALDHGVSGSLSSGLHHARREHGAGFCTFNGLVTAAKKALDAVAGSVLILDLDAHCGGGTASLIADEPNIAQVDVSVSSFDRYEDCANARLQIINRSEDYLGAIESGLREVERMEHRFTLCLYNAGMDPFEGCSIGGLTGITRGMLAEPERLVFEWCQRQGMAAAFVLAGGYLGPGLNEEGLVDLHRLTLSAAASATEFKVKHG